ncbi:MULTISPECIES: hypothetical protein [unclassified Candidatus Cardinium]|uniref:hypothetical protein n=1 Tax=unclassified Candidatus Cardinium TaxID=2641185 RepID=UPI001FB3B0E5|nr:MULTISPECIES: hypothetical protein [unclassified Candidatus Cardinium]
MYSIHKGNDTNTSNRNIEDKDQHCQKSNNFSVNSLYTEIHGKGHYIDLDSNRNNAEANIGY